MICHILLLEHVKNTLFCDFPHKGVFFLKINHIYEFLKQKLIILVFGFLTQTPTAQNVFYVEYIFICRITHHIILFMYSKFHMIIFSIKKVVVLLGMKIREKTRKTGFE